MQKNRGALFIVVAAFLFGSIGIVNKYLAVPPIIQNFYRFLFSSVSLFLVLLVRKEIVTVKKESFIFLLPISLGIIGSSVFFASAVKIIPVGIVAFIFYLFPTIAVLLSRLLLKEAITKNVTIALLVASIGVLFLSWKNTAGVHSLLGYAYSLFAAVCYSIVLVFSKKLRTFYSPVSLAFLQALIVSIVLFPVALRTSYTLDVMSVSLLVFLGIVVSGAGIVLLNAGLGKVTANRAAILMYIEPVAASILAAIFFRQIPSFSTFIGCVVILSADYFILTRGNLA